VVVKNKDMESKRGLERERERERERGREGEGEGERENKNKRTNITAKGILMVLS